MSHLIIGVIIVLAAIIIPAIFVIMSNYQSRMNNEKMLVFFNNLGANYNFSFIGREVFPDKIIGLDDVRKKILIVEQQEKKFSSEVIDLYEVQKCKVKKTFTAITSDGYKKNRTEDYLVSIALVFDFKTERTPVSLVFYKYGENSVYDIKDMENKSRAWEASLSKMLPATQQQNA